jgi:Protein of unknown function (DUF2971)
VVQDISLAPGELPALEPTILYHYTDPGGLQGIIECKCLRASDVWFMNDAREARYGLDVVERALSGMQPESADEQAAQTEAVRQLAQLHGQDDPVESYIACLSKHGDQLSQWRAYGRPRGFSIGFDSEVLRGLCPLTLTFDQPSLREVSYDPSVQDGMVVSHLRSVRRQLASSGNPALAQPDVVGNIFMREAILLAPAFKDPAFKEEAEVRLQIFHDPTSGTSPDLKFRNGAMGLTPYLEIDLIDPQAGRMTALLEIIVGPQPNQDEALRAVRQLLAHNELEDVEVKQSAIPLRP